MKRGSGGGVGAMVGHRTKPKTTREKGRKVRSANRQPEQRGRKGVSLLEGDDLNAGEEFPINAPQLINKTSDC